MMAFMEGEIVCNGPTDQSSYIHIIVLVQVLSLHSKQLLISCNVNVKAGWASIKNNSSER